MGQSVLRSCGAGAGHRVCKAVSGSSVPVIPEVCGGGFLGLTLTLLDRKELASRCLQETMVPFTALVTSVTLKNVSTCKLHETGNPGTLSLC